MRHLAIAALLTGALVLPARAETLPPLEDSALVPALAQGREIPLEQQSGDIVLRLRLYEVPLFEGDRSCVPETEAVCEHRYLLAVGEFGEYPASALYDLGSMGEVIAQEVLAGTDPEALRLRLMVLPLPSAVLLLKDQAAQAEIRRYLVRLGEVRREPD